MLILSLYLLGVLIGVGLIWVLICIFDEIFMPDKFDEKRELDIEIWLGNLAQREKIAKYNICYMGDEKHLLTYTNPTNRQSI